MIKLAYMKFGSHLYGLETKDSDIDYRGVYIPSLRELLLGSWKKTITTSTGNNNSKNTSEDTDIEWIALPYFLEKLRKGDIGMIDMLHCTDLILTTDTWNTIVANRRNFYTKKLSSLIGYISDQASKYGIKGTRVASVRLARDFLQKKFQTDAAKVTTLADCWEDLPEAPYLCKIHKETGKYYSINGKMYKDNNQIHKIYILVSNAFNKMGERAKLAEKNEGVDWKAMSHALRAGYQARDIFLYGDFDYPLNETKFILDVKLGKLDFKTEVAPVLEKLVIEVKELSAKAKLPEICLEDMDVFLFEIYDSYFNLNKFDMLDG